MDVQGDDLCWNGLIDTEKSIIRGRVSPSLYTSLLFGDEIPLGTLVHIATEALAWSPTHDEATQISFLALAAISRCVARDSPSRPPKQSLVV